MDIYTQLEDKLRDMTNRMTQETRYFEMCDAKEQEAAEDGESSEEASRKRFPLLQHPHDARIVYPDPRLETKDSLAVRAELSATAFITLNQQVDGLLETLPVDEFTGDKQSALLEQLAHENDIAGKTLRAEVDHAHQVLVQLRSALEVMGDGRSASALASTIHMELRARGLPYMHQVSDEVHDIRHTPATPTHQ